VPSEAKDDPRVVAVRADRLVGHGTCSSIDECYSDQELLEALDESEVKTPEDAIKWAREGEGLHLEKGLNQRWGEDNDPQLLNWKEWNDRLKEEE
jgi:hypothetical protein